MLSNPPQPRKSPVDLWQSISKLVALHNQTPPLKPALREGENLPLSFPQERLWWLSQLRPDSSAYNISLAFQLTGCLDELALQRSLQTIVDRHEALRTRISIQDDRPVQKVAKAATPEACLELKIVNLEALDSENQDLKASQLVAESTQRPFDLAVDLPIRTTLLKLDKRTFIFLVVVHHIAFDGWSEGVLYRELTETYAAFSKKQQPSLRPLPVNYADFAIWQRQWLRDDIHETLLDYWVTQMNGTLAAPQLPVQSCSSQPLDKRSARQTLSLDTALTQTLKTFSKQQGVTLFVTLLTAFKGLLHPYCKQDVLMVCTPVANRNRNELKNLIGYFVNLLLLQTDLSGNPSFESLLQQVRQVATGAFAYQDLPVQQLISQFKGIKADVSRVMFVLQNTPRHPLRFPDMTVTPLEVGGEMTDFDLFLSVMDDGERLVLTLKYDANLFEAAFIQTLLARFRQILSRGIANPQQSLTTLLPLEKAELQILQQQRQSRWHIQQAARTVCTVTEQPQDDVEKGLVEIWKTLLGVLPRRQDNFFELGGQSLIAVQLLSEIEARFGKKLPLNTLLKAATVEQLASVIRESEATSLWPVIVPLQQVEGTQRPPLFCIHGVGGAVIFYREIAQYLEADIPIYALQSLGLDGIQTPLEKVEDMAKLYIKEMRKVQPHGPYHVTGYSFGGLIALEIAQQLQQAGEIVAFVGMLDTLTPELAQRQPSLWEFVSTHLVNLWNKEPGKKWKYIMGRLKRIRRQQQVQHREYEEELKRQYPNMQDYNVLGPNYRAADAYVARPYAGGITVFRAKIQSPRGARFPALGWDTYAQTVDVHTVPGSHFAMIREPNARILGSVLNKCLRRAHEEA